MIVMRSAPALDVLAAYVYNVATLCLMAVSIAPAPALRVAVLTQHSDASMVRRAPHGSILRAPRCGSILVRSALS